MRIFTGIALPQSTKIVLSDLCQSRIPAAHWEHSDDFHLTLRFIGDVDEATYERYKTALTAIRNAPFKLTLKGVGCFPEDARKPPKVLWVGIQPNPELMNLQSAVTSALEKAGLPKDKFDSYSPHITLARLKTDRPLEAVTQFLDTQANFHSDPFPVNEFVIFQTLRLSNGANYSPIAQFRLHLAE